jgi:hypothetical protein
VQLSHVITEAESDIGIALQKKVYEIHDTFRRFIKSVGFCIAAAQFFQELPAVRVFPWEETVKQKAAQIKTGDREGINSGTTIGGAKRCVGGYFGA